MKGHGRKHRETGGANEAEEDVKDKPEARTDAKKIDAEAEEMKKGGRAKRKRGGRAGFGEEHEGTKVDGEKGMHHAGRKPRAHGGKAGEKEHEREERRERASGGRAKGDYSDAHPFTSARKGEDGPGRKVMKGELGEGED